MAQQRVSVICTLGGLVLIVFVWHCQAVHYIVDDSFITFRYVKNFVAGNGLVYNPGERVEGYTNFLWTILLSSGLWLQPHLDLVGLAQTLGVLFGAATILLVFLFTWRHDQKISGWSLVASLFLALNGSFVAWSTGGLETTLFAFLVFAGCYAYVASLESDKHFLLAPILFAFAALARPEGILFFGVNALHLGYCEFRAHRKNLGLRWLSWVLAFAAIYVPYFLWRFAYYGFLFPNTFYAKVGSGISQYLRGVGYLSNFGLTYGAVIFLLPLVFLLKRNRRTWSDYFLLQVGAYLLYIIYVGGDGLAFCRFVVFIAPLIYVLVQEGFRVLYQGWESGSRVPHRVKVAITVVGLLCAFGLTARSSFAVLLLPDSTRWYEPQSELSFPLLSNQPPYLWFDNYFVDRQAAAARWLETNAPPGALVAATPAGAIGYYMHLRVIDMLGLTDSHIAQSPEAFRTAVGSGRAGHEKGDGKYVLSRSPEFILIGNVAVLPFPLDDNKMSKKLVLKSENELWAAPEFHKDYELVCVQLNQSGLFSYFSFYKRKDVPLASGAAGARCSLG